MSGFEQSTHLSACAPPPPVIFITAQDGLWKRTSMIPNTVHLRKPFVGAVLLETERSLLKLNSHEPHANHKPKSGRRAAPPVVSEHPATWPFGARRQFGRRHIAGGNEHSPGDGLGKDCGNACHFGTLHLVDAAGGFCRLRIVALPCGGV